MPMLCSLIGVSPSPSARSLSREPNAFARRGTTFLKTFILRFKAFDMLSATMTLFLISQQIATGFRKNLGYPKG